MDWIKVKTNHILYEYNDLRDSEFVAWIKIMALTAQLEHEPTREQILKIVNYKTLDSLQRKLNDHSIDLQYILNKVLIDVQCVLNVREQSKNRMKEYRAHKVGVTHNVSVTLRKREDKIREEKNIPPISPKGGVTFTDDFISFWKSYPKKTGKKAAWKAWKAARDKPPISEILTAISRQRQTEQWQKENGQYIPNPATWINQGRWADEVEAEPESSIDAWARRKQAELEAAKNGTV